MAITRSRAQKKLHSSKSQSISTDDIPQVPEEEHPGDAHNQETISVTCQNIEETASYMISIPTDVLFILNSSSMQHINRTYIKEELTDHMTTESICKSMDIDSALPSIDMSQHETPKENKITGQSNLVELAPATENMNSNIVEEGREKLETLETTRRNEEKMLYMDSVPTNVLCQINSRSNEQRLIVKQEPFETENNSFNVIQSPCTLRQEESTINESSDIPNSLPPVLDATLSQSRESSNIEHFLKTTRLEQICLGAACQMNLNTIDDDVSIKRIDPNGFVVETDTSLGEMEKIIRLSPTEIEFETIGKDKFEESPSRAANLHTNISTLTICDEISKSELKMSTLLCMNSKLRTSEHIMSSDLLYTKKTTPSTTAQSSTTKLTSKTTIARPRPREDSISDLTKQNCEPVYESDSLSANKQVQSTEFNIGSPLSTSSISSTSCDEILSSLTETNLHRCSSPTTTIMKDEQVLLEKYYMERRECSPDCIENRSKRLKYDHLLSRTNSLNQSNYKRENKSRKVDKTNSNYKRESKSRRRYKTKSNYKRENKSRKRYKTKSKYKRENKRRKVDKTNPDKSVIEIYEINSDDETGASKSAFIMQEKNVETKWSNIRFSISPEVPPSEEKDSDSDYGWEDPPPPKPFEDLDPSVKEKLQTFNRGLYTEYNLDVIEANKNDLFEAIFESIQKKKNHIRVEYARKLLGTDNFRSRNNDSALSNNMEASKVEINKSLAVNVPTNLQHETNAIRLARELAPTLCSNKHVFHGRINKIEIAFQGQKMPPYLLEILKQEKRLISDLVIKYLMPYYYDGRIQPKIAFNKVAREISHVFYQRNNADESTIKNYIDCKFRTYVID